MASHPVERGDEICEESLPVPVLLAGIGRSAMRLLNDALEPTGLKPRHIPTLSALHAGPLSQSALAEATAADPTTLVGLLNDLEIDGLVLRRRDPADRRRHIVALSDLGRRRLETMQSTTRAVEARMLAGLDENERSSLVKLLGHLAKTMASEPCPTLD